MLFLADLTLNTGHFSLSLTLTVFDEINMIYMISFIIIIILIIICQCFVPPLPHLRDAARSRHVSRRNGRLTSISGS